MDSSQYVITDTFLHNVISSIHSRFFLIRYHRCTYGFHGYAFDNSRQVIDERQWRTQCSAHHHSHWNTESTAHARYSTKYYSTKYCSAQWSNSLPQWRHFSRLILHLGWSYTWRDKDTREYSGGGEYHEIGTSYPTLQRRIRGQRMDSYVVVSSIRRKWGDTRSSN